MGVYLRGNFETLEGLQAEFERSIHFERIYPRDVTVLDVSTEGLFEFFQLGKGGPGGLGGVIAVAVADKYLEGGRHRVVLESAEILDRIG